MQNSDDLDVAFNRGVICGLYMAITRVANLARPIKNGPHFTTLQTDAVLAELDDLHKATCENVKAFAPQHTSQIVADAYQKTNDLTPNAVELLDPVPILLKAVEVLYQRGNYYRDRAENAG